MSAGPTDDKATCIRSMEIMSTGTLEDFAEVYTADALDREADEYPPLRGPEGLHRSAERLRGAFSDMRWEVHEAVQDGALVVLHTTMTGHQTGTLTAYGPDGAVSAVFPSRGRSFSATQTHWFRMEGGKIAEHWANRDDMTMGRELGWLPPTPGYIVKMVLARRQAQREAKA
ncbi:ester cyclase [Actinomycetospora chibensis]|uniref:Ester cyclase n=2 Tax=Actinomycetospora chibensis TaxID=663606 RepID=A0ABV9RLZ0_9PSEU